MTDETTTIEVTAEQLITLQAAVARLIDNYKSWSQLTQLDERDNIARLEDVQSVIGKPPKGTPGL
ncbi:hypothetical protein ABID65_006728 [Bradyrhizobium sp. S3.9.2]|uniref:hypothetical protein n=1 Tax=Bradyrhizobium sp. S3.9.2 TaxID=3156432 RepID=UPI00339B18B2